MVQQIHERALDRRLARLADPIVPPGLVARMIAEIPQMPQFEPEGVVTLRLPQSISAPIPDRARDDLSRRIGWASVIAGLAACFGAVLFLPQQSDQPGPATPAAQVALVHPQAAAAPTLALAAETPHKAAPAAVARKTPATAKHTAGPEPLPADDDLVEPRSAPEPRLAANAPVARAAPIALDAPNDRIAIGPVAGPPAPQRGLMGPPNDEFPATGTMGSRGSSGMGFGGMGSESQGFPGSRQ